MPEEFASSESYKIVKILLSVLIDAININCKTSFQVEFNF